MRIAIALGSNLDDRLANLQAAQQAIADLPNVRSPLLSSPIYETDPVGCEPGAGKFLNAVIEFEYDGEPLDLLKRLREIEGALGRPADHQRNVSRKIDIDILYVGDMKIDTNELQLPHPRIHEREFVLRPLADIRPALVLPGQTKTVRELLVELREKTRQD
jgi:2-amino-4-hydroxy-6-hydroxymethyldihydropteridine diphosphokinase